MVTTMTRVCIAVFVLLSLVDVDVSSAQYRQATGEPAEPWLQWRLLHTSLSYYSERDTTAVVRMLSIKFGLMADEAHALQAAGDRYLSELESIESDAKAAVLARYGATGLGRAPSETPIVLQPGKSLRDMVREDGLHEAVTRRRRNALQSHLGALQKVIGATVVAKLEAWCKDVIAPRARSFDGGSKVAGPAIPSGGDLNGFRMTSPKGR